MDLGWWTPRVARVPSLGCYVEGRPCGGRAGAWLLRHAMERYAGLLQVGERIDGAEWIERIRDRDRGGAPSLREECLAVASRKIIARAMCISGTPARPPATLACPDDRAIGHWVAELVGVRLIERGAQPNSSRDAPLARVYRVHPFAVAGTLAQAVEPGSVADRALALYEGSAVTLHRSDEVPALLLLTSVLLMREYAHLVIASEGESVTMPAPRSVWSGDRPWAHAYELLPGRNVWFERFAECLASQLRSLVDATDLPSVYLAKPMPLAGEWAAAPLAGATCVLGGSLRGWQVPPALVRYVLAVHAARRFRPERATGLLATPGLAAGA